MLRLRLAQHGNALVASALIGAFLLAFVGVTTARSVGAQSIPTLDMPGLQMVTVDNKTSPAGTLDFSAHVQLNLLNKPVAKILNEATAIGECAGCQTLAIAVQINVVSDLTQVVKAANVANVLNRNCPQCLTQANTMQVWILAPVNTVTVPANVTAFVKQINHEFWVLENTPNLTPSEAVDGINGILAQNSNLIGYLITRFAQSTQPNS